VLNILEFNSTRKRMSVIVRDDRGKLIIFTKVGRRVPQISDTGEDLYDGDAEQYCLWLAWGYKCSTSVPQLHPRCQGQIVQL
jgi:hypothetical protein